MESGVENIFGFPQFIFRQSRRHYALSRRRQTQRLMQTQQRRVLLLLSAILVVTDDFVCMGQLVIGQEDVPGVCDGEEVFSPTQKCALVPPRLLDVYGGGQFCCHCYLGKQIIPNIIPIIPQEKEVDRGWFKATSDCCCLGAISSLLGWIDTGVILRTLIQRRTKNSSSTLTILCRQKSAMGHSWK